MVGPALKGTLPPKTGGGNIKKNRAAREESRAVQTHIKQ
jgi:hypothetical protein